MNYKNFIILTLTFCLSIGTAFAGPFRADAKTKRIPAGATFQLEFLHLVLLKNCLHLYIAVRLFAA